MVVDNCMFGCFQLMDILFVCCGELQIEVIFDVDVNGIMYIFVKDKGIGKEQFIKIEVFFGLSDDEIKCMKVEVEVNVEVDKKCKEDVELVNKVDFMIFQIECQLKEYGDKLLVDKKQLIEDVLVDLKKEYEVKNIVNLQVVMDCVNDVFQVVFQEMYNVVNVGGGVQEGV